MTARITIWVIGEVLTKLLYAGMCNQNKQEFVTAVNIDVVVF
jgi:hypothetical protein